MKNVIINMATYQVTTKRKISTVDRVMIYVIYTGAIGVIYLLSSIFTQSLLIKFGLKGGY